MKTKLFSLLTILLVAFMCVSVTGCSKSGDDGDEPERVDPFSGGGSKSKVSKPVVSLVVATAASGDFDASFKVVCEEEPKSVTLYYGFSASSDEAPTNYETRSCRWVNTVYGDDGVNSYFYKVSKAGIPSGMRIFFYAVAKNSAGTGKTAVDYRIMRHY